LDYEQHPAANTITLPRNDLRSNFYTSEPGFLIYDKCLEQRGIVSAGTGKGVVREGKCNKYETKYEKYGSGDQNVEKTAANTKQKHLDH
jgi:hypothetical protein